MTADDYSEMLTLWRSDVEAIQRKYDALVNEPWGADNLDPQESMALYRAWCAGMTAWWELADVIKSLRAAQYRLPRSTDSGATDAERES